MADSFHLISLGCAKNLVDSEVMLGALAEEGFRLEPELENADHLIVNTCGFIQPAVEEAIAEVLDLVAVKEKYPEKKIIVVGCFVQRYRESLIEELPEVDLFVGTEGPTQLGALIRQLSAGELKEKIVLPSTFLMDHKSPRVLSTPNHRGWLKITEGCDNRCSYCMIPSIRGRLRSRRRDDLMEEAKQLEGQGVRELSLIAQDSTAYGNDLQEEDNLNSLLEGLLEATTIPWLRILYLYPTGITDSLLDLIAANKRIVPYLDIPFQHVSDSVLRRMNRPYGYDDLLLLVKKIRAKIPDIALRTTFLVGFPGETEEDFLLIEKFMKEVQLDHVGVFPYANEEGAPSENFVDQVEEELKEARMNHLLQLQSEISSSVQKKYVGQTLDVLVHGVSEETELLLEGRTKYQAPEVDGCVYINDGMANPGDIVQVEITDSQVYDLVGGIVELG